MNNSKVIFINTRFIINGVLSWNSGIYLDCLLNDQINSRHWGLRLLPEEPNVMDVMVISDQQWILVRRPLRSFGSGSHKLASSDCLLFLTCLLMLELSELLASSPLVIWEAGELSIPCWYPNLLLLSKALEHSTRVKAFS